MFSHKSPRLFIEYQSENEDNIYYEDMQTKEHLKNLPAGYDIDSIKVTAYKNPDGDPQYYYEINETQETTWDLPNYNNFISQNTNTMYDSSPPPSDDGEDVKYNTAQMSSTKGIAKIWDFAENFDQEDDTPSNALNDQNTRGFQPSKDSDSEDDFKSKPSTARGFQPSKDSDSDDDFKSKPSNAQGFQPSKDSDSDSDMDEDEIVFYFDHFD